MEYARLGETGLIVSRLALGTMTFGKGVGGRGAAIFKVDDQGAEALVGQAFDAGINFFNTADAYAEGRSEEMLGRALGSRRKDAVIATKVGNRTGGGLTDIGLSRRHILMAAEESLRRMGTDWIDVYLFHKIDPYTPLEEMLEAANQLVSSGKVRYVGFSNWPAWMAAKAVGIQNARGFEPLRAAEMYYSLVGRDLEHEILPFAEDVGIGTTVWSPLAGGLLSGRYSREDPTGGGGRLSSFNFIPVDKDAAFAIIDVLREIGASRDASPAQVALAWLLAKRNISSVIVGASSAEQFSDNLGALGVNLTADEMARLDEISAIRLPYPNWFTPVTIDSAVHQAMEESGR